MLNILSPQRKYKSKLPWFVSQPNQSDDHQGNKWQQVQLSYGKVGLRITAGENASCSSHCAISRKVSPKRKKVWNRNYHSPQLYHSWVIIRILGNACPTILAIAWLKILGLEQLRQTNAWIKKTWDIYTMEIYVAIKKNKIMKFTGKHMQPESTLLIKISQTRKDKLHGFSLIYGTLI